MVLVRLLSWAMRGGRALFRLMRVHFFPSGIQIHLKWKNDPNLCVAVADLKNVSSPNGVSVSSDAQTFQTFLSRIWGMHYTSKTLVCQTFIA